MELFTLRELDKGIIRGYEWPLEDPKKVVCIVHGIGEYGGRYDRVAGRFNQAGYAVIALDQRGHGDSIGRKGDCAPREEVLEDISSMLSYAARKYPGKDIILYGHSMGGNITLDYRYRGTFRDMPAAYLITAPWIRLVHPIPDPVYRLAKLLSKVAPRFTIGSAVDEADLGSPNKVLPYHDDAMVHNRISVRCAVEGFDTGKWLETAGEEDGEERIKDIPTLIMHGGDDRICDIEGSKVVYRNALSQGENISFKEWPGLFHEIHNGGPESEGEEVIDAMIEYFESC